MPNPLAHSCKSALVLGEPGATTVPASLDSYPPFPGLFQSPLAGVKPVANVCGGLILRFSSPEFIITECLSKSYRRVTAGKKSAEAPSLVCLIAPAVVYVASAVSIVIREVSRVLHQSFPSQALTFRLPNLRPVDELSHVTGATPWLPDRPMS